MNINSFSHYYFVGIGGIGMSALARYFRRQGKAVAGYDRNPRPITRQLQDEGIDVQYSETAGDIPAAFLNHENCLVVYTPAVSSENQILRFFQNQQFTAIKRAYALGLLSKHQQTLAVAGTHGKTSVSTLLAHLLYQSSLPSAAILGGIAKNYKTNLLLDESSNKLVSSDHWLVTEADEYDRSFLHLQPHMAVITATDADHLDIYQTHSQLKQAFQQFASQVTGPLLVHHPLKSEFAGQGHPLLTYSLNDPSADFYATAIRRSEQGFRFQLNHKNKALLTNVYLPVPGQLYVENAVAAMAVAYQTGMPAHELQPAVAGYQGVVRRMDLRYQDADRVFIDDYAHHPRELERTILAVQEAYPGKQLTGIFQPHLYSRTRDFANEFAQSLSLLDRLFLLDIYPAREAPIPGVTSRLIFEQVVLPDKQLLAYNEVVDALPVEPGQVILTLGAGNIDALVADIVKKLQTTM